MICTVCTNKIGKKQSKFNEKFDFRLISLTISTKNGLAAILFLLFTVVTASVCQRLPEQAFTTHDGLASNLVTMIFQDSKGYLWIGTDEGIR